MYARNAYRRNHIHGRDPYGLRNGARTLVAAGQASPLQAPPQRRRRTALTTSQQPSQQQQQQQPDLNQPTLQRILEEQQQQERRRARPNHGRRGAANAAAAGAAAADAPASASAAAASAPRPLSDAQLLQFERDGFVVTRRLVPAAEARAVRDEAAAHTERARLAALRHRVRVLCPPGTPEPATPDEALRLIEERGSDPLGFLQFFHLHRDPECPSVRALALGPEGRLARVAAQLLGVKRVRLYQDALFLKQPGWAPTNWHSDLRMTRLDTNAYVTAWLPLRAVAGGAADSGLEFAAGSHRDFALAFWHDAAKYGDLGARGYAVKTPGRMEVGDASWHHGWTLHAAGAQPPGTPPRMALAVSYFADGARLLDARAPSVRRALLHDEDDEGTAGWVDAVRGGAFARHPLLPVAWG